MKRYLILGLSTIAVLAAIAFVGARMFVKVKAPRLEAPPIIIADLGSPVWNVPDTKEKVPKPDMVEATKACTDDPEFTKRRQDLGLLVNRRSDYHRKLDRFALAVDEFRGKVGIPLPFRISPQAAEKAGLVFSRCRSFCKPGIYQAFAVGAPDNKSISFIDKKGKLQQINLAHGDIQILLLDELNTNGIPFRTWAIPITDGPWFIDNQYLFTPLDISGLWLRVDSKGHWKIVEKNNRAIPLNEVKQPLSVPGCVTEDHCFEAKGRHFKSPRICN